MNILPSSVKRRIDCVSARCLYCILSICVGLSLWTTSISADGPGDNALANVRPIPPPGIELSEADRTRLLSGVQRLRQQLQAATKTSAQAELVDEVEVLLRAVQLAVDEGLFYEPNDLKRADRLLETAANRLAKLGQGANYFDLVNLQGGSEKPQLAAGGFRSYLDQSVQPYGVVIPAGWSPNDGKNYRLDVWLHGRGEKNLELQFLDQRLQQVGQISPADTIVLHPFGRYCNAFKFAGEADVLEAIRHVQRRFSIDPNKISMRGFSMGGAGCWQMAAHYPGLWFAATPGAGFCETQQFLKVFQKENFVPTPAQAKLLNWYDIPGWSNNFRLLPTIAYSGELDQQKQAADVMEAAIASRGFKLKHLIGPQTAHKIHPDSLQAIEQELTELGKTSRSSVPTEIDFTTYSLRYARNAWIEIEGLKEHWTESRIQAKLEAPNRLVIKTQGITRFNVLFDANQCPLKGSPEIEIDGMIFAGPTVAADGSWKLHLLHDGGVGGWSLLEEPDQSLRKRPGLQGPIDDAFYGPILFVRPTKPCTHGAVERWTNEEWTHAQSQWRKHYRGETPTIQDVELTPEMARDANLIVFGCPNANSALGKVISQLPIEWTKDQIRVGEQTFDPVHHVVVMIFPNPMNPQRYIVINSGFTFREYAYLNNARQIAMLPDWAVIDVNTPPNAQMPGKVVAEGFFNEQWQLIKKQ